MAALFQVSSKSNLVVDTSRTTDSPASICLKMTIKDDINLKFNGYAKFSKIEENYELKASEESNDKNVVAEGFYLQEFGSKGWNKLTLKTYNKAKTGAYIQSYLAGYLEGRLTSNDIKNYYLVKNEKNKFQTEMATIVKFFTEVAESLDNKLNNKPPEEKDEVHFQRMMLGYCQLLGMFQAYNLGKSKDALDYISIALFLILQADGELPELKTAERFLKFKTTSNETKEDVPKMGDKDYFKRAFGIKTDDHNKIWTELLVSGRCTSLVKVNRQGQYIDIYAGHTTWGEDIELKRTVKNHNFQFEGNDIFPGTQVIFSAYPGTISSTDDFYLTSNQLMVTETTITIVNVNLYEKAKSSELYYPNFMRVLCATRFSKTTAEWEKDFRINNSGTYSSQWMVIDYKVIDEINKGNKMSTGLFLMLEQVPGNILSKDMSEALLNKGYMAGVNRAYLEETQEKISQKEINKLYSGIGDYSKSSREHQFSVIHTFIVDIKSMMQVLRYNGYKQNIFPNDPSNSSPESSISARYNLNGNPSFIGGIDTKVVNREKMKGLEFYAVNGPTGSIFNPNIPNYKPDPKIAQALGLPEQFNFPIVKINPSTMLSTSPNDLVTEFTYTENCNNEIKTMVENLMKSSKAAQSSSSEAPAPPSAQKKLKKRSKTKQIQESLNPIKKS